MAQDGPRFESETLLATGGPVAAEAFSVPQGERFAYATLAEVIVMDRSAGIEVQRIPAPDVRGLAFGGGDGLLWIAFGDGHIQRYDVASGRPVEEYRSHRRELNGFAADVEANRLVTTARSGWVRVHDRAQGIDLYHREIDRDHRVYMALRPDGRELLMGSSCEGAAYSYVLQLWNLDEDARSLIAPMRFGAGVASLAISADGTFVAYGQGTTLRTWRRDEEGAWSETGLPGHPAGEEVKSLAFSPDSRYLAVSGSRLKGVYLHGIRATAAPVLSTAALRPSTILVFSPDGAVLAAAGEGGVRLLRINPPLAPGNAPEGNGEDR